MTEVLEDVGCLADGEGAVLKDWGSERGRVGVVAFVGGRDLGDHFFDAVLYVRGIRVLSAGLFEDETDVFTTAGDMWSAGARVYALAMIVGGG